MKKLILLLLLIVNVIIAQDAKTFSIPDHFVWYKDEMGLNWVWPGLGLLHGIPLGFVCKSEYRVEELKTDMYLLSDKPTPFLFLRLRNDWKYRVDYHEFNDYLTK
jgi:hypothetical protein